jgi:hypothetical protein
MGFQGDVVWDLKPTMIKIGFDMIGSEIIELNGQSTSNPLIRMEKKHLGHCNGKSSINSMWGLG